MSDIIIKVENLYKEYRLGVVSHGTLYLDLQSWWARIRGKEDPNSIISEHHDRSIEKDHILALQDVSFEAKEGEVVGIIGRNGAGKSTLLKILTRITLPTKGNVKLRGRVGSLLEVGTGFHPELTGRENIYLNGAILGMSRREVSSKLDEIIAFAEVEKYIDTPVKRYSSGMYVRLAFAVAAHLEPEILLVDEVLAVGDVAFQQKCLRKMDDVGRAGRTILFVSHNMAAIGKLCRRVLLVESGRLTLDATADRAISQYLNQNLLEGSIASASDIESRMEGVILRNNPYTRFREIALRNHKGQPKQLFRSDEDIVVSIVFECFQPVWNLRIMVDVVDEGNVPILSTENVDDSGVFQHFSSLSPGVYQTSCILPANSFGSKLFFLTVQLIYPKVEHIVVNKILKFEVDFIGFTNVYQTRKNAFMRPQLKWDFKVSL